jgi:hypothetical protein
VRPVLSPALGLCAAAAETVVCVCAARRWT